MAAQLLTQSGPWCGALTDTSAVIRASVVAEVNTVHMIIAESEDLRANPTTHSAGPLWADLTGRYPDKVATFHLTGLRPDTQYFYSIELNGRTSTALAGRFRTAPELGSATTFSFACSGCARRFWLCAGGAYQALAQMNDLRVGPPSCRPLFFCYLGDFHYENIGGASITDRLRAYDKALGQEPVRNLFRNLPIVYGWDDHDFLGNSVAGGDPKNHSVRQSAREAYDIFVPHYPLGSLTGGIHQSFQIGRVLFVLTDARYFRSTNGSSDNSAMTMLGADQKSWLKDQLLAGKKLDLIIWLNSVPWIAPRKSGEDNWGGYGDERAELSTFITQNDIRNICMVSGDAHVVAIDDGTNSGYSTGNHGGFPVFQAASLHSFPLTTKGGPYSMGEKNGGPGYGVKGRQQFGICNITYSDDNPVPEIAWTAFRAKSGVAVPILPEFKFRGRRTFAGF